MLKQTVVLTLLAASVGLSACDRGPIVATGPGSEITGGGPLGVEPSMTLTTTSLTARPSGRVPCPLFHPFLASTSLVVRADGGFRLTEIAMSFRDGSGNAGPQVTLPAPVPTRQFGSELETSRRTVTFPLDFAFGCGTGRSGTIIVVVTGRDERGDRKSVELRATVM